MAPSPTKKGLRIGRALRYAAFKVPTTRLPRVRMTRRNAIQPHPGEVPIVILRVQVFSCKDLLAKDKNGKSDP
jgi:phosphatidylserine decarboxylase